MRLASFNRYRFRSSLRPASASLLALTLCAAPAAAEPRQTAPAAPADPAPNTLTPAETAAGWTLLFDGRTTKGWRGFHADGFPAAGWAVEDGALKRVAAKVPAGAGGDIITAGQYGSFELLLDWKLSPGGNSGVKYLVAERPDRKGRAGVSYEMQILDDERHPDAKEGIAGNRTAGALYDLIAPATRAAKPAGEWNRTRLVVNGRRVEHWLNGQRIVQFEIGSPEMKALIAKSKYKDIPNFGEAASGHILLQDHGDEVWFRNIKIRHLPAAR